MAVRSGFFNSVNGDRRYDAKFFAEYFATFIGDGVFPNPSNGLQLVEGTGMQTILKVGKGWIKGYYVINDSDYIIKHDIADGILKRIDRIVMRLNHLTRQIEIVLKKGSQASNPTAPVIQRDAEAYELVLSDVLINAGATQINQGNITDQRLNKSLCGIVHGVVDQVDTTTIFNQYQGWFEDYSVTKAAEFLQWQNKVTSELEAWIEAQEEDFEAWRQAEEALYYTWLQGRKDNFDKWFETVKDILDTTADGKLFNKIQDHEDASMPHLFLDETDAKTYQYGFKTNTERDGTVFMFKDAADPQSPTTQIVGPTKKTQDEIREKVDNIGYLQDINGDIYKPRMDEQFMVIEESMKLSGEVMGCYSGPYGYAFNNTTIYKYEIATMEVVAIKTINTTTDGTMVTIHRERSMAQDDIYIYVIATLSPSMRFIKFRKDDLSLTLGPLFAYSTYGDINRLIVSGDTLIAGHIDGGVTGVFVLKTSDMYIVSAKRIANYGYLGDFIVDANNNIIVVTRNAQLAVVLKTDIAGNTIASYTTPTNVFNESTSGASYAKARLFVQSINNKTYLYIKSTSFFSEVPSDTLALSKIQAPAAVDMLFMHSLDVYEFVNFTNGILYRMHTTTLKMLTQIAIEEGTTLQQLTYITSGPKAGIYAGSGSYKNRGSFLDFKTGYTISHYEKEVQ